MPERKNVVLTTNTEFTAKGSVVVHSIEELINVLKDYDRQIYVFGGESIYRQLLPYCKRAYITRFNEEFLADSHLPRLDNIEGWQLVDKGEWQMSKTGVEYRFDEYLKD